MSEQIKLPEDIMLEIQKLRDELTQNVVRIGRLNVQASFYRKDLEIIENDLKTLYDVAENISIEEEKLQNKVVAQFGTGKLDFESGYFYKD